ncbi:hypothetical protein D9611_007064 [Ephemerocybe angulata]|uniref:RecQ-mediated genome instability protein 1 n=1 Tax=Ephemerocybe angulata TaxID=980116 RepID=A0A8H5B184_9AGAR|nr:hypothetical protein D9611_007064 [Tulosesus angulatus]
MTRSPIVDEWVNTMFPSQDIRPEWLSNACYEIERDWKVNNPCDSISEETYLGELENKIVYTNLSDVTARGSRGLPAGITLPSMYTTLDGPIVLELVHMMDVGVSAFVLEKVRLDREQAAYQRLCATEESIAGLPLVAQRDPQSVATPTYPRKCMRYTLSDGRNEIEAVEFRKAFPFLLGETSIGLKMRLENVPIIGGVAFLDPDLVEILGGSVEEQAEWHYTRFRNDLTMRMGEELVLSKKHGIPCRELFASAN